MTGRAADIFARCERCGATVACTCDTKQVADAIPNSAAEPQVTRGRDESLIPNLDSWDDLDADVTPNSVSITVSEETADWITAKAIEHGCTEDEVIATLIADWNEAVDG